MKLAGWNTLRRQSAAAGLQAGIVGSSSVEVQGQMLRWDLARGLEK